MKNLKPQQEIKKGTDNNWLTIADMETSKEREIFQMLMDRNEPDGFGNCEYCDTLVSFETKTIRQDHLLYYINDKGSI